MARLQLPQTTEECIVVYGAVIVGLRTLGTIQWEVVVPVVLLSIVSLAIALAAFAYTFPHDTLLFLMKPGQPLFHNVRVSYFTSNGLVASLDTEVPFPRLFWVPPWSFFTLSMHETAVNQSLKTLSASLSLKKPYIRTVDLTSFSASSFSETELLTLTLSDPIKLSRSTSTSQTTLKLVQHEVQLSITNDSALADLILALTNPEASVLDPETELSLSLRGKLMLFNRFTIYRGALPSIPISLSDLISTNKIPTSNRGTVTTIEHIDIYPHEEDALLQSKKESESSSKLDSEDDHEDEELVPTRPPGFAGLLPGITLHKSPLTTEGLHLSLDASLTFTFPPALDLHIQEIAFGVYLNRKMITSGLISAFHIESNLSYGVDFSIQFNNPQTLKKVNLSSLLMDVTGLVSRALGVGIGAIETLALETVRATTGVSVASQVHVKVLSVKGFDCVGGVTDVEWLARILSRLDHFGRDFSLFTDSSLSSSGSGYISPRNVGSPAPPDEYEFETIPPY
ncbi:hypothetical protein HDU79_011582 [Rhizoclosmatium sp. JEL0117]|nr:hypothetical protein HDU79_011582 [Rhizoclosmatium sp. JEL0117]